MFPLLVFGKLVEDEMGTTPPGWQYLCQVKSVLSLREMLSAVRISVTVSDGDRAVTVSDLMTAETTLLTDVISHVRDVISHVRRNECPPDLRGTLLTDNVRGVSRTLNSQPEIQNPKPET